MPASPRTRTILSTGSTVLCSHDLKLTEPCPRDGEPVYIIDRIVRTRSGKVLREYGDRQHIIYVNGDWRGDDELGMLMEDFHTADPERMHYTQMAEPLRRLKETEEGEMQLSGLAADFYNNGYDVGRDETRRENALKMINAGFDPAAVASALELSEDELREILASCENQG